LAVWSMRQKSITGLCYFIPKSSFSSVCRLGGDILTVTLELLEKYAMECANMIDQEDGCEEARERGARKQSERAIKTLPFSLIVLRVSPPSAQHPQQKAHETPQHYLLQQLQQFLRHRLLHPPQQSSAQAYKRSVPQ